VGSGQWVDDVHGLLPTAHHLSLNSPLAQFDKAGTGTSFLGVQRE
jgi:hypothetical protein